MPPPATGSVPSLYCHSSIDGVHRHRTNSAQGSLITSDSYSGKAPRINGRPRLVFHKHYWYIMDIYDKNSTGGSMVDCRRGRSDYRGTFQLRT